MDRIQRTGVSLEPNLLKQFDAIIEQQGYPNRSEAIRDLIREKITQQKINNPNATATAAVLVVYDHHKPGLSAKLTKLQHNHLLGVISSVHVHLDHDDCLEVILLRGRVKDITALGDKLVSLKGVKLGKTQLVSLSDEKNHNHAHNHHHHP
jgi:CopG family nickel-responsive transcriptional regulator